MSDNNVTEQPNEDQLPLESTDTTKETSTPPETPVEKKSDNEIYDNDGNLIINNEPDLIDREITDKYSFEENSWNDKDITLDFPSKTSMKSLKVAAEISDAIKTGEIDDTFLKENAQWGSTLGDSQDALLKDNLLINKINNPDSDFKQSVDVNGKKIQMSELKTKDVSGVNLKGAKAKLAFSKHLGIGTVVQVPLYHSGMWVNIKTPTEIELIELNRNMALDKISLGRQTFGLTYESITVYTVDRLMNFIIDHIQSSSVKVSPNQEIDFKELIMSQDIPILVWGIASAMFPRGFQYHRACIDNYKECRHVLNERINLNKLQWTDINALPDKAKTHMGDRQASIHTIESIKEYQKDILALADITFDTVNKSTGSTQSFTLKSPTVKEYVAMGYKWVAGIVNAVSEVISEDATTEDKNSLIESYAQSTLIRQYGHWIKSIEFNENIVDDIDSIEGILDIISQDNDMREEIKKKITEYIDKTTISLIGIPSYTCPECGKVQTEGQVGTFSNIIPLDPINVFFNLLGQKLALILNRA